ncbi:glycosyltransferase family 2 protein [Microbulbifer sp. CNSA002]|uniref:glycosyltransferase family 2 protein n=1 Tax=Microbulbifer sp. CNSA002 TaxID=3373604 RepID=UPI0039B578DB
MISIVIISKSSGVYLNTCLQSIIRQQYKDIEILVLHSCENDGRNRINNFTGLMPRVRSIHIPSTSQIDDQLIFEFGVKNTLGEYVGFIDEGDCWYPTLIPKLQDIVNSENPDVVFFSHNKPLQKFSESIGDKSRFVLKINSINVRRFYRRDFVCGNKLSEFILGSCVNGHSLHWITTVKAKSILVLPEIGSYSLVNMDEKKSDLMIQRLVNQYHFVFDYLTKNARGADYKNDLLGYWLLYLIELRPLYGDKKVISLLIKSKLIEKYTEREFNEALGALKLDRDKQSLVREWYSDCNKMDKYLNLFYRLLPSKLSIYIRQNGFRYSMSRGFKNTYYRLPDWVKSLIKFTRERAKRRVSNDELLERLEYLIKQGRFEQYMSIINEDFESKLSNQITEIKKELMELKKEVH